jgi:hypothetical protein
LSQLYAASLAKKAAISSSPPVTATAPLNDDNAAALRVEVARLQKLLEDKDTHIAALQRQLDKQNDDY